MISGSSPENLGSPVMTYDFPGLLHFTVFLDEDSETWFLYALTGDEIRVYTAPLARP